MSLFLLLSTFLLGALIVYLIMRAYLQNRLDLIREMCLHLHKPNMPNRFHYHSPILRDIALALNDSSRQMSSQIKEIEEEKDTLKAIISSMTEGVIIINNRGMLEHVSPNMFQMLELRSTRWDDRPYWEIIRHQEINAAIEAGIKEKTAVRREIVDLSIPKKHFSMQVSPVLNQGKELIAVIAVLHDITELKHIESLQAEFVANVSHELKTPLTSIKGYVETLKDAIDDDPKQVRNFIDIIQKQSERLEHLVRDLLILSSLESQSSKFDKEPVDVTRLLETVISLSQAQIAKSGNQVFTHFSSHLPLIQLDKMRMEQVFVNLLDNAIKYTPANGRIDITAHIIGNDLKISFKDTGVGIPHEHLSRIFDRFYRIDKARSRDSGGTGLGLSIVQQIIANHGGYIDVESKVGQGSIFTITIPINN